MLKIVYFNYAALGILSVILLSALFRRVGTANGNRAFILSVAEVLLTTVMDIIAVSLDNSGAGHVFGKFFFHSAYLLLHTLTPVFYLVYLISLTDAWHKVFSNKSKSFLILFPIVIYFLAFLGNCVGLLDIFHIDENDVYIRGNAFLIGYIVGAFYMLAGVVFILEFRKLFSVSWILTLFAPYPFILAAVIVQFLVPALTVELFLNALALIFVYTNIQKPEELQNSITGLNNVTAFESCAKRAYFNCKDCSALLIHMKKTRALTEMLGYDMAHLFLRDCANQISSHVARLGFKAELFSGRLGEYYVFSHNKDRESLEALAQILAKKFNSTIRFAGTELRIESALCLVSIPKDIPEYEDFLSFAEGKLDGLPAGKVEYASELFQGNYQRILLNINKILADAIQNKRFELYYQPIYSCSQKKFVSAEALIRLNDPEYGFVSPEIFIPAAEKSGMIQQISDYVLETACAFISSEDFQKLGLSYLELNLSALECVQADLPSRILKIVRQYGVSPEQLALEITETAMVFNPEELKNNLDALASAGFRFCLDDYGTGYSDTRRIIDLPLSIIKLDKSFLDGIEKKYPQVILRDTVQLINDIDHSVVAEGVENQDTLDMLQSFGCDMIQGYYFSRPLPKKEFEALCIKHQNE